jgi:hypothetical protein
MNIKKSSLQKRDSELRILSRRFVTTLTLSGLLAPTVSLCISFTAAAKTLIAQTQTVHNFYVSPSGSDANPGTAALPWATFQKAVDTVNPGDVINVGPGTYRPVASSSSGVKITRSGTSTDPITIQGINGRPVLDCANITPTTDVYCFWLNANWWIVKNIDVTGAHGAQQIDPGFTGIGILLFTASNNRVENVRSHGNQGPGFYIGYGSVSSNNLILNCDAYDNYDPLSTSPGGNADGIDGGVLAGSSGNVMDGVRAWHNSDDGIDLWAAESSWVIRNSWAWANGYGAGGNGNGFKLGRNTVGPRHLVCNNLSFNNTSSGFDTNGASGPIEFLNNTAYNNGSGYGFVLSPNWHGGVVSHYLRNNASVGRVSAGGDQAFNSWNLSVTANAADFLSVDPNLALSLRNADGSLPTNNLFRLAPTSDLIDKGANIGIPYSGATPDLGAYELGGTPVGCNRLPVPAAPTGLRVVR